MKRLLCLAVVVSSVMFVGCGDKKESPVDSNKVNRENRDPKGKMPDNMKNPDGTPKM